MISTYKSAITGYKTLVVVTNGAQCGHQGYYEAHLWYNKGQMYYRITDGYKSIGITKPVRNNLKSAINIVEGHLKALQ